ncbi:hypothetical protein Tcan_17075 [Toxocara canis]|nr:hypothetical protein Tcan_17075 [Toxocara canis]
MAESNTSGENRATTAIAQGLAFVLITRLQEWCRQLLWLTIICVIGCCGDSITESARSKTIRHVRRNIRAQCTTTRMKSIAAIEMQLLCHLTQSHGVTSYRRRVTSRAPSPQLYDISEEAEIEY